MKELFRKELIVAVIVSVIATLFIQPIIQLLMNYTKNFTFSALSFLLDQMYLTAGKGVSESGISYLAILAWTLFIPSYTALTFNNISAYLQSIFPHDGKDKAKSVINDRKRKSIYSILAFIYMVWALLILGLFINNYASEKLTTSFEQRLTILSPKISDQKYKELKADWASMRTRKDYEEINNQIDMISQQYQLILPAPFIK